MCRVYSNLVKTADTLGDVYILGREMLYPYGYPSPGSIRKDLKGYVIQCVHG